jgi:antitoxin component YwqK of YwqJK toxin-antitoxin module
MMAVRGDRRFVLGVMVAVAFVAACWDTSSRGQATGSSSSSGAQESIKIEPYKGPPVYLEEVPKVAEPTVVTHEKVPEKYEDGKTIRVERDIARYSDNSLAADGNYREYHPNGKPFIEGQYRAGRQVGEWTFYFDNGQLNRKATYKDGKPDGSWEIHRADGTLRAKRSFKNGLRDGEWITYDETGKQPLAEEHYVSGVEDGVWKTWYPNGQLRQQASFKEGKRDGASAEWNDKGQKLVEAEYTNGKLNGTATRYFADGRTIVQKYTDGRFESETKK